ncbi:interleukin-6-like isoform 2-T2 [Spinachia spinachia]
MRSLLSLLLSAVTLAALLPHASGAPVEDTPTAPPAGETSGVTSGEEAQVVEGLPSDLVSASPLWHALLKETKLHEKEFEDEFPNGVKYNNLENNKVFSVPETCPLSNFNKEACLHRTAHGLLAYTALLKKVEKEYPNHSICSAAKSYIGRLISLCKEKMRNPEQVTALTGSQEAELLRGVDRPNIFENKMVAHSILRQFHFFLLDSKQAITKRETRGKGSMGSHQILEANV